MNTSQALIIGETLVDIVHHDGDTTPPREAPGGSPANVAVALGRLGRPVQLATWLADDAHGKACLDHLHHSHVHVDESCLRATHTSTADALIDDSGSASYTFDLEWAIDNIDLAPSHAIVHTGSLAAVIKPGASCVEATIEKAREQALIVYDPNPRPAIFDPIDKQPGETSRTCIDRFIALADVVKASDEDVAWLYNIDDLDGLARNWLGRGVKLVVITRGAQGSDAWAGNPLNPVHIHLNSIDVDVVDTVGAGDTVSAGVIDALWQRGILGAEGRDKLAALSEEDLIEVITHAQRMAAVTVSREGANPPWKDEIL